MRKWRDVARNNRKCDILSVGSDRAGPWESLATRGCDGGFVCRGGVMRGGGRLADAEKNGGVEE